jgi:hypothetical protein
MPRRHRVIWSEAMGDSKDEDQKRDSVQRPMSEAPRQPQQAQDEKKKAGRKRKARAKAAEGLTKLPPD